MKILKVLPSLIAAVLLAAAGRPAVAALGLLDYVQQGVNGVGGLATPMALALSPGGEHVYVASAAGHSIALFARDPYSGRVDYRASYVDGVGGISGLKVPSDVAVTPDGAHVYATSLLDGSIVAFAREASGQLTFLNAMGGTDSGVPGLLRPFHIVSSVDGKHVYVVSRNGAGQSADVLAVYARNAQSGELGLIEYHTDGIDGAVGLSASDGLAWSPDGLQLYIASGSANALTVWTRDAASGRLTLRQTIVDGAATQNAATAPRGIAVSADGAHVYVAGSASDSVAIFARAEDGELAFLGAVRDGVAGITGLDAPLALAMSRDGKALYVGANASSQVHVFDRDPATGLLALRERLQDVAPNRHLERVSALRVPSSGAAFYALASTSNELSLWGGSAVDLAVTASIQPSSLSVGATGDYQIVVSNVGETPATDVQVMAAWPASVEAGPVQTGTGAITAAAQGLAAVMGSLDPGASIALSVPVKFLQDGAVSLHAQVAAAEPDRMVANNSVLIDVQVTAVSSPVDEPPPPDSPPPDEPPADGASPVDANTAPVATDDMVTTMIDVPVDVLVLFNDFDRDAGDAIRILAAATDARSREGGQVTYVTLENGTEALRYTPPVGFSGTDQFDYTISDLAGLRASAQVTVNVRAQGSDSAAPVTPSVPKATHRNSGGGGAADVALLLAALAALYVRHQRRPDSRTGHAVEPSLTLVAGAPRHVSQSSFRAAVRRLVCRALRADTVGA